MWLTTMNTLVLDVMETIQQAVKAVVVGQAQVLIAKVGLRRRHQIIKVTCPQVEPLVVQLWEVIVVITVVFTPHLPLDPSLIQKQIIG